MEKVYFSNSKGDELKGILSNPGEAKSIVVLCHGFASAKDGTTFKLMEPRFNEKGIATLRFDFYGHGESDGKFEDITISEARDDALKAINFVKEAGYEKIGMIGSSFGGMAAILAAAQSKDLVVLGLKAPVSDYLGKLVAKGGVEAWKEQGYLMYPGGSGPKRLNYSFFEDAETIKGYEEAAKIEIPSLIVHGDADADVPIEQSKKAVTVMPDCQLEILPGADHRFSKEEDFERMLELLVNFVSKHLG